MNKAKIINLAVGLVDSTEEALMMRDQSQFQNCKKREKQIIEEVNSKPTMPKVFDDWYKDVIESHVGTNTRKTLAIAFNTLLTVDSSVYDESESSLKGWFVESNSIEDLDRISKCIDAIRYGYEVEK